MQLLFDIFLFVTTVSALELTKSHIRKQVSSSQRGDKIIHGRKTVDKNEFDLDADFDMGTSVNVNHNDVPDQLQLDTEATTFNFIWIPISNLGLVVKVDTNTGDILSAYYTSPSIHGWGDPSRTTVDKDRSVWVANRNNIYDGQGSIVHIGLLENNQCEDRDGTPGIRTSNSTTPLDWINTDGPRGVGTAQDECIIHYTKVNSGGTHHLSIDANNDVWVSGTGINPRPWDLVKGVRYDKLLSGTINRTEPGWWGYGGYGGLMDKNGTIWSASYLLRWNPYPALGTLLSTYSHDSYGLCIDSHGNVWNTALNGNVIRKFGPDGTIIGEYPHGNDRAQGCVVDRNDDVWVAHSKDVSMTVGHLKNDGTHVGNVDVGYGPTGVSVDGNGKIWSSNFNAGTLLRIDPDAGVVGGGGYKVGAVDLTVALPAGSNPYNYGNMTGSTLISPPNTGTWSIKYSGVWKRLEWVSVEPDDSNLVVEARDSNSGVWVTAENGIDLPLNPTTGYLEVQVIFTRASTGKSPILYGLSITVNSPPNCELASPNPQMILPAKDTMVPITIENVNDPEDDLITIKVTSIFQDEPLEDICSKSSKSGKNCKSSKSASSSLQVDGTGIGTPTAEVRAERDDAGNGRVYHISFMAEDEHWDSCESAVQVCIPLDPKKSTQCVDDGPFFNSTQ